MFRINSILCLNKTKKKIDWASASFSNFIKSNQIIYLHNIGITDVTNKYRIHCIYLIRCTNINITLSQSNFSNLALLSYLYLKLTKVQVNLIYIIASLRLGKM